MAEPLSFVASIIAVATIAGQITATLSKLRTIYELPGRLHAINNEVTDLEVVLRQVGTVAIDRQTHLSIEHQNHLPSLVGRANIKLLELRDLVQRLSQSCVGNGKFVTHAKAWWVEKPRLLALQQTLHTIKVDLNIVLGAIHSQDLIRVQLDLQSVSLVTTDLSQKQTIFQDNINQTLQLNKRQVDQRLDSLEQILLQQFAMLRTNFTAEMGPGFIRESSSWTKAPMNPPSVMSNVKRPRTSSNSGGLSVRAIQYTGVVCQPRCACTCHTKLEVHTPDLLQPVLGHLFIGCAGLPGTRRACNNIECKRSQAPTVSIEYWFPLWFLAQIIRIMFAVQPASGPQLQLRTLRRVPDSSQCISFALGGNTEGIRSLFIQGLASPHDVDQSRNFSILRWAVFGKQYETCKYLLEAGADPAQGGASDRLWDFTLSGTLTNEDQHVVRKVLDSSDYVDDREFPTLHEIVLELHGKPLEQELRENPMSVLDIDIEGRTALFWAAARGDERSTITLLAHGADPNAMDKNGVTPLYVAANEGRTGCIRLLLMAGAKADPIAPKGTPSRSTPLLNASMYATDPLAIKTLLEFGAKIDARSPDGETPLIAVARSLSAPHALLLMETGANLNACAKNGKTALTTAIAHNNHGVLQVLLDRWYKYDACPRLAGPDLLSVAVEYADAITLRILATADHFKIRGGDQRYVQTAAAAASECLKARLGLSPELTAAFDELLSVIGQEPTKLRNEIREKNIELLMESGLLRRDTDSSIDEDLLEFEDAVERRGTDLSEKQLLS